MLSRLINPVGCIKDMYGGNTYLQVLGMREEEFPNFESLGAEVMVVSRWKFILPCTSRGDGPYGVFCESDSSGRMKETRRLLFIPSLV